MLELLKALALLAVNLIQLFFALVSLMCSILLLGLLTTPLLGLVAVVIIILTFLVGD
jgi:hypothetical protein